MSGQLKVAGFPFEELKAAPLQEWNELSEAGGADLVASPELLTRPYATAAIFSSAFGITVTLPSASG